MTVVRMTVWRMTVWRVAVVVSVGLFGGCGGGDAATPSTRSATSGPPGAVSTAAASSTAATSTAATSTPASTRAATTTLGTAVTGVAPEGFGTAAVEIRRADGTLCELCTYIARTGDQRALGLMGVTDLAGHDGMIFEFEGAEIRSFWMKNTVMPLSAAWFGDTGTFVGAVDMEPCPPATEQCPTYGPPAPARHVLEVPQGGLTALGIGEGATLVAVGGECEPT